MKKFSLLLLSSVVIGLTLYYETGAILMYLIVMVLGLVVGIAIFLAISPLLKEQLLHQPSKPKKIGMFVEVGTGRSIGIDFGGNFAYQIDDDMQGPVLPPEEDKFFNGFSGLWYLYKKYVWRMVHVHVYIPFFMEPKTYDLPRYEVVSEGGKRVPKVVDSDNPRYRSNHVRTAPFPWYFVYAGADIQTIPYTVIGSAQAMIDKNKVMEALYHAESWNVLLDQALNSVIQAVVRSKLTIDIIIGSVSKDIWDDTVKTVDSTSLVAKLIHEGITNYKFDSAVGGDFAGKSLADLGIIVLRIDITDFKDELTEPERIKMRSATLGRQEGRARDLTGQGIAQEQKHMAVVLESLDPDLRKSILKNRAFVDAVSKGGSVEALLTALAKSFMK